MSYGSLIKLYNFTSFVSLPDILVKDTQTDRKPDPPSIVITVYTI